MVILILIVALLIVLVSLGIEIGITSWSIRRVKKYQCREFAAESTTERAIQEKQNLSNRLRSLDEYAAKISWLLNFLYKRYDKFADLEKELEEGPKDVPPDTPVSEVTARYDDLRKAHKIIRVTVKASERMGNLMDSIISQVEQIAEDLQEDEDKKESKPEESAKDKEEEPPKPESAE